jgi:hypothetical protein
MILLLMPVAPQLDLQYAYSLGVLSADMFHSLRREASPSPTRG